MSAKTLKALDQAAFAVFFACLTTTGVLLIWDQMFWAKVAGSSAFVSLAFGIYIALARSLDKSPAHDTASR